MGHGYITSIDRGTSDKGHSERGQPSQQRTISNTQWWFFLYILNLVPSSPLFGGFTVATILYSFTFSVLPVPNAGPPPLLSVLPVWSLPDFLPPLVSKNVDFDKLLLLPLNFVLTLGFCGQKHINFTYNFIIVKPDLSSHMEFCEHHLITRIIVAST